MRRRLLILILSQALPFPSTSTEFLVFLFLSCIGSTSTNDFSTKAVSYRTYRICEAVRDLRVVRTAEVEKEGREGVASI